MKNKQKSREVSLKVKTTLNIWASEEYADESYEGLHWVSVENLGEYLAQKPSIGVKELLEKLVALVKEMESEK